MLKLLRRLSRPRPAARLLPARLPPGFDLFPGDDEVARQIRAVPAHFADLVVTAANVVKATVSGYTYRGARGIAGATITAGQVVYKDASDSDKIKLADNDTSSATAAAVGIAMHAALAGQPIEYCESGPVSFGAILTAGHIYVLSSTAGAICPHADLAAADYSTRLGWAYSTSILIVDILATGIVLA